MIFVDFSRRDLEGRFYLVRLGAFDHKPKLGEEFVATDLEEFVGIRCEVLGVDLRHGRVYYRPVNPADVPGTVTPQWSAPTFVNCRRYPHRSPGKRQISSGRKRA